MAHVGKFYKLQFRRDLAQVANNRQAYPEAFRWFSTNTTGAVAADLINNVVPLVNVATNAQPPMVWTSATRTISGIPYRARLTLNDPFHINLTTFVFEVRRTDTAALLFMMNKAAGSFTGTPSSFSSFNGLPFSDSPDYRIVAGNFFWNMTALGWANYNP